MNNNYLTIGGVLLKFQKRKEARHCSESCLHDLRERRSEA